MCLTSHFAKFFLEEKKYSSDLFQRKFFGAFFPETNFFKNFFKNKVESFFERFLFDFKGGNQIIPTDIAKG